MDFNFGFNNNLFGMNSLYFPPTQNTNSLLNNQHCYIPTTTGTAAIGIRFNTGVILAADNHLSSGTLSKYYNVPRIIKVNENIILSCSGDYGDFENIRDIIMDRVKEDESFDDGIMMEPRQLTTWLSRVMYEKYQRFKLSWTCFIIGGIYEKKPYLSYLDLFGTTYEDRIISNGLGKHLATPFIRQYLVDNKVEVLTQPIARHLVEECMAGLYYRNANSSPKYQIAVITEDDIFMMEEVVVRGKWDVAKFN